MSVWTLSGALGMKKFGYCKTGLFVCVWGGGVISMHFKAFLKVNVQNGNIFWGSLNFEYCFRFG